MYDEILKQIANVLFVNVQHVEEKGLLKGRLGIAIFFYHYSRYTGNPIFEKWADEYIKEMLDALDIDTIYDFSDGLSGMAWGISYLIENNFIEAESTILKEIDNAIADISLADLNEELISSVPLFTKGLYFLQRKNNEEIEKTLNNDLPEYVLKKELLPDRYVNSIHFFIEQAKKIGFPINQFDEKISYIPEKEVFLTEEIFFNHCWEYFLYPTCKHQYKDELPDLKNLQCFVDSLTYNLIYPYLSIYKGLSGLGLRLISLSDKQ